MSRFMPQQRRAHAAQVGELNTSPWPPAGVQSAPPPMRCALALLVATATLTVPPSAWADGRIAYLTRNLEKGSDPRLRAQSALLLAKSQNEAVLAPLCAALSDASEIVRTAVAKALLELGDLSAIDCLRHTASDPDGDVRAAVRKALAALEAIKNRKPELYISLAPLVDKGGGLSSELVRLAEDRLRTKLRLMGALMAPPQESKSAARIVEKAKGLKGFYLVVEFYGEPGGGLRINIVCFTYPDKALQGEVNVKASGGKPDDLIRALAPKALEDAAETFEWST